MFILSFLCYNKYMYSNDGGEGFGQITRRVRACDYLTVAQLFLQKNFLLEEDLSFDDIKPRLLGHWGTCHGINVAYANLKYYFGHRRTATGVKDYSADIFADNPNYTFVLGPGHGFPALQANLFIDGELYKVDPEATRDEAGIAYLCRNFSWPGGFPSHASPYTPHVICEGGELGYALGAAYGFALGHPEQTVAVLIGDGELETATALDSLNLVKLVGDHTVNGKVLPILHLNGYKISGPTLYGRKSERELHELLRGFGYMPIEIEDGEPPTFQEALRRSANFEYPFLILRTEKGATGPQTVHERKVAGNYLAHQIPLLEAKSDPEELKILQSWLKSYRFGELYDQQKGFLL